MRHLLLAALSFAVGCSQGLGQPCDDGASCPEGLVCQRPPSDGGTPVGICDYPSRAEGERCTAAAECEAHLTCSNHFEPGARYGICVLRRADGERCFVGRDCQSGRCVGASGQAVDGVCQPR